MIVINKNNSTFGGIERVSETGTGGGVFGISVLVRELVVGGVGAGAYPNVDGGGLLQKKINS